jgi:hypothetical protein
MASRSAGAAALAGALCLGNALASLDPLEKVTAAVRRRAIVPRAHIEKAPLVRPPLPHLQSALALASGSKYGAPLRIQILAVPVTFFTC